MSHKVFFSLIISILLSTSCSDDCRDCVPGLMESMDMDTTHMEMDTTMMELDTTQMDSCIGFQTIEVEFYTTYPLSFRVTPATFETVTEQVLVKAAGTTNSTYEDVTEVLLKKDAYTTHRFIPNTDHLLSIINDHKDSSSQSIPCIDSLYEPTYEIVTLDPSYEEYTYQALDNYSSGGDTIMAEYTTRTWHKLVVDLVIEEIYDHVGTKTLTFTLPDSMDIHEHIRTLAEEAGFPDCLSEENYLVL